MAKRDLNETEIRTQYITPAIVAAGWEPKRGMMREEFQITDGPMVVRGKMSARNKKKALRADYVLFYKTNQPLAVVEAKDNTHGPGAGMQQALEYAEYLQAPYVYTSNGDSFVFHDRTGVAEKRETEIPLADFPRPETLWQNYLKHQGLATPEVQPIVEQEYPVDAGGKSPRYYQANAINRTVEAIAKGQDRILLVMATGTGKTYTAFNIVWRLWKAGVKKRILFLADRNALLTQTKNGDFAPMGNDIMTIIKHRKVDKSYQVYFALYQGLTGPEESQKAYKEFSEDFFDLIVIDECHRGSASEASEWREILTHFKGATQIGLTATPKETKDVSNITYFGEPVYTYSLKQGILDGFLAPYKVVRILTDVDAEWRPPKGMIDRYGYTIADKVYNSRDYDSNIVLTKRHEVVARKITEYLKGTDRYAKTIVFCENIEHAEAMRKALVNENADLVAEHKHYVVKITGDDEVGKRELENFMDVEERYPVIATTSKLLTTGVDTKMVKLVVLETNIGSMTEFKQIVGRGTRLREEEGKTYFTIMDFRGATRHFADPEFDGEPVVIYEPGQGESPVPPDEQEGAEPSSAEDPETDPTPLPEGDVYTDELDGDEGGDDPRRKYYVDDQEVGVVMERVQHYGADGTLVTESLKDYTRKGLRQAFASLDDFIQQWNAADRKEALIKELTEAGLALKDLQKEMGPDWDLFDLICHLAFDAAPLTRAERAKQARKQDVFAQYGEQARTILDNLLRKYEDEGITAIEDGSVLKVQPLSDLGKPVELVRAFGKKADFEAAVKELERALYNNIA